MTEKIKINWFDKLIFYILMKFIIRETSTLAGLIYKKHRMEIIKNAWMDYWQPMFESFFLFIFGIFFGIWSLFKFSISFILLPITLPFSRYRVKQINEINRLRTIKIEKVE